MLVSEHNRQAWRDWSHWLRLGHQLTVERVKRAIHLAEQCQSKLTPRELGLPGMSSGKVRHLLNNLAPYRYLEVRV